MSYSSQKDYEGLEWESVKSKYEDIRKDFVTLYKQRDGLPHNLSDSKLSKSKSADQQHLAVIKEELSLKTEMVSEMKQMDKEYQKTMARFASAMENLSHSVSSAFGMMGTLLQRSQPRYWQPQMPQYMAQQQPLQGDRVLPGRSNDLHYERMLYAVRCLKSNEDMILALAGQFKQLSHEPEKFR